MSACFSCNTELPAGARWCPICHTNAISPQSGRLASPARRVGAYVLEFLQYRIACWGTMVSNLSHQCDKSSEW